jgi:transcription elongation factor Elf1
MLTIHGEGRRFIRYYSDYVDCDFCGEQTRGRVYASTESVRKVTCGSCHKEIATDPQPDEAA